MADDTRSIKSELKDEPIEEEQAKIEETNDTANKTEIKNGPESTPASVPVIPEPISAATVEANGIDTEDSINLTIGEDEENLLAEEV